MILTRLSSCLVRFKGLLLQQRSPAFTKLQLTVGPLKIFTNFVTIVERPLHLLKARKDSSLADLLLYRGRARANGKMTVKRSYSLSPAA
jgi:hypothetical protein